VQQDPPEPSAPDDEPRPEQPSGTHPGAPSPVGRRVLSQRDLVIASLLAKPDDGRDQRREGS
jgi:hypothetical protein